MDRLIRKISIGNDVNNALHIAVGAKMGNNIVSSIIETLGNSYEVWVEINADKDCTLWKQISNMPVIVEYDTRLD